MTRTIVITPPAPILTPAAVRQALPVPALIPDAVLTSYIAVATATLDCPDGWLGRAIGSQTLELQCDAFPGHHHHHVRCGDHPSHHDRHEFRLLFPPIAEIVDIEFIDTTGTHVVLPASSYSFDGDRTITAAFGGAWPSTLWQRNSVRVRYVAGYTDIPPSIVQGVILGIAQLVAMTKTDILLKQDTVVGVSSQTWETSVDVRAVYDRAIDALLANVRVYD